MVIVGKGEFFLAVLGNVRCADLVGKSLHPGHLGTTRHVKVGMKTHFDMLRYHLENLLDSNPED